jgi:glycosyltransferase involved in cell wall biosynthesis
MDVSPLVSIITATYNHEKYISDCIHSVLAQTYQNWEMIIVDDGSNDNTYNIAQSFAKEDQRITVFTQKNIGIFRLAETYNFGLTKSKGKYIAVLEGDDVWLPEKLALQVSGLEKDDNLVLSYGQAYSSNEDLKSDYKLNSFENISTEVKENDPVGSLAKWIIYENFIPALTVVIRRESLELTGGFKQPNNLPLVDLPTWMDLSLRGKFCFVNVPLARWRVYPNQVTKTYTAEMWEGFYQHALSFYEKHQSVFGLQVTRKSIDKFYFKKLVIAHSRSGRYQLIRKNFKEARKSYTRSIFHYGFYEPLWKVRSFIGILFSFFHLDIEGLARKLGRVSYK